MNEKKYLSLITSQHRDKPKFYESVKTVIDPIIDCFNFLNSLNQNFDIDVAKGQNLQILAEWVGASKTIPNSMPLPFFGFADQPSALPFGEQDGTGWGGYWRESGVSSYSAITMTDDQFKRAVKAKILLNQSDSTLESAKLIIETAILKKFRIKDNFDMSVHFEFLEPYELLDRELVRLLFPLPSGVRLEFGDDDDY